jgi:hypothetical protein
MNDILATIDQEISRLQQARTLLNGGHAAKPYKPAKAVKKTRKRRRISAEGLKRIAEAQRKRWAAKKKA